VLPALWRGDTVDEPALGLVEASLGTARIKSPELFVGGASDAVLEIAARYADGWHTPAEPAEFATLSRKLDEICEGSGRYEPIEKAAQVFLADVGLDGAREVLDRLEDAGATAVTFILHEERGPSWVHRLGDALGLE
jgi:alkanesulfonate monooxygenase SsuD/methylene tetrahydromethanopterin reductase-like flavin-dependent oxidoreductase (luciferase family)